MSHSPADRDTGPVAPQENASGVLAVVLKTGSKGLLD
jgi:hypothetical protein